MIDRRRQILAITLAFTVLEAGYTQENTRVVARLGEQPITDRDIDFQLGRIASASIEPLTELPPAVLQAAIHLLGQQRQALQTLRTRKLALGREDVERWLEESGQSPSGEKLTAAEIIREQSLKAGITESNLRDHLTFRLSWQRFLKQQLTESNMAKHFENQSKRFNGTRFKVSIVDLASTAGKSDRREKLAEFLTVLRSRLKAGELSWHDLAAELQQSELLQGKADKFRVREELWIRGTGDVEQAIVSALMTMEPEAYSEPIHTATGVHLVNLLLVEAGSRELPDVRDEVRAHMLLHLLDHLARQSDSQLPLKAVE
jgi:hypothetical protein